MEVIVNATPKESEEKKKEYGDYDKWEIESAVDCLIRAEEIKQDKEKMKYVKQCMDTKYKGVKKVISSIADIKKASNEMDKEERA